MKTFKLAAHGAIVSGSLLLAACASSTSTIPPLPAMPTAWVEAPAAADPSAVALGKDWWRGFAAEPLLALIAQAERGNPDLNIAAERVLQAEAQVQIAGASLFPALNLSAGTSSSKSSAASDTRNASNVTLSASYELDLWQGNAQGVNAVRAKLRASRFDRDNVRLTLLAGVATAYFQYQALNRRLSIATSNLAASNGMLAVVEARVRNGSASALDLARQQSSVLAQRAAIPDLALQQRQTQFALAVLVGEQAEDFRVASIPFDDIAVPAIAAGLPAELLTRRPDLASAEAQLLAAHASLLSARAALLPNIQLTGSAGLASDVLLNVLHSPTASLNLGAALLQPIFDAGRLRGQVDIASSQERELLETYRKTSLAALADVEGALAAASRVAEQEQLQQQLVTTARNAYRLANIRYRAGSDDLLSVLDAERTLLQAQEQGVQIRLARLQATMSLFKALGGGWDMATAR